ncbi:hypothetical protein [Methylobacillus caricis]|nr:hypothetical protein [Methylobacillus caricis]
MKESRAIIGFDAIYSDVAEFGENVTTSTGGGHVASNKKPAEAG